MTSLTSVDFPDPDTPVTETKRPIGISTSISCRLLAVTPVARSRRAVVRPSIRGMSTSSTIASGR